MSVFTTEQKKAAPIATERNFILDCIVLLDFKK